MAFWSRKTDINKGISFGVTSGVITTLGLMVGLNASTQSRVAVLSGILSIAIADSFSDAMGMHVSEESQSESSNSQIWKTTILTLLSKLVVALSFAVPIVLFPLNIGVKVCVLWGVLITTVFSYRLAKNRNENALHTVSEHVGIAIFVVIASYFVGKIISALN
ncbi:MAG: VIT1/CCC1 transporter family protein [Patescibacteria group bacterium]|jgi:VIT1/CCC1 family predicted Fe2+/Mn2+ transporter